MKETNKEAFELDFQDGNPVVKEMKHEVPAKDFSNLVMVEEEEVKLKDDWVTDRYSFVVIDIETTGLEPFSERITEIVALRYNKNWDYLRAVYHNLLNPQKRIPMKLQELTKITPEMVKYKPYSSEGVKELLSKLNIATDILIAHNAAFELKWLKQSQGTFDMVNWICTRGIYLYMRDGNTYQNNFKKNYSRLKQVCEYYGIEYIETDAHRAEYDVLKTRLVAEKMIKKLGLELCLKISAAYVRGKGYGARWVEGKSAYERFKENRKSPEVREAELIKSVKSLPLYCAVCAKTIEAGRWCSKCAKEVIGSSCLGADEGTPGKIGKNIYENMTDEELKEESKKIDTELVKVGLYD